MNRAFLIICLIGFALAKRIPNKRNQRFHWDKFEKKTIDNAFKHSCDVGECVPRHLCSEASAILTDLASAGLQEDDERQISNPCRDQSEICCIRKLHANYIEGVGFQNKFLPSIGKKLPSPVALSSRSNRGNIVKQVFKIFWKLIQNLDDRND